MQAIVFASLDGAQGRDRTTDTAIFSRELNIFKLLISKLIKMIFFFQQGISKVELWAWECLVVIPTVATPLFRDDGTPDDAMIAFPVTE